MYETTIDAPNQTISGYTVYPINHGIDNPTSLVASFDNVENPQRANKNFTLVSGDSVYAWSFGPTISGSTELTILGNLSGTKTITVVIS